jgi:biopolymer transport protein ExbD
MNLTPLIDMSFLLITFFVMTLRLTMSAAEQQVELPRADQAKATHERPLAIVTLVVDRAGAVRWGDRALSAGSLAAALSARAEAERELKVVVRADARSPFRAVGAVMRAAAEAGVERMSVSALKVEDTP